MSSGVEFEEDKFSFTKPAAQPSMQSSGGIPNMNYGRPAPSSNTPRMALWLMKHGIKSSNAAQAILIAVVVINIIVTFIIVNFFIL